MFRSIRARLFTIILIFSLIVICSSITFYSFLNDHIADEAVFSVVDHEKAIIQQMTLLSTSALDNPQLATYRKIFDQNLQSLKKGGEAIDSNGRFFLISPSGNAIVLAKLDAVSQSWIDFERCLDSVSLLSQDDPSRGEALGELQADLLKITNDFELISTSLYEQEKNEHLRLMQIQGIFLAIAMVLIPITLFILQRGFVNPLLQLNQSARRIGEGQLSEPVVVRGDDEIGKLGRSFDTMRLEIENQQKKLEARVEERTQALIAAHEFSQNIVRQMKIEQLLRLVTQKSCDLLAVDQATLCLLKPDGTRMETISQKGELVVKATQFESQLAATYHKQSDVDQGRVLDENCASCALNKSYDAERCMIARLQVGNTAYGALCVVRINGQPFDSIEKQSLILFANSAAIVIHNYFLMEEVRNRAELTAGYAERERIAAELHDNLAQSLALLGLKIGIARELVTTGKSEDMLVELDSISSINKTAYTQLRVNLENLVQPNEPINNVYQDLETFLVEYQISTKLHVENSMPVSWAAVLAPVQQKQVKHIIREALNNVHRHAQATNVKVGAYQTTHELTIFIQDNGRGFEPRQFESGKHLGLEIMRSRAERCGARLSIHSVPGQGTRVEVCFPLKQGA